MRKCNLLLLKKVVYFYLGVKQYKFMRVSECFEVKMKGIIMVEMDLLQNYKYYFRNRYYIQEG